MSGIHQHSLDWLSLGHLTGCGHVYFIFIGNILVSMLTTLIDGSKSLFYQNEMLNAFIFLRHYVARWIHG